MHAIAVLIRIGAVAALAACTSWTSACTSAPGVSAAHRERLALIRDTAAGMGITNAALIAGIAVSETHLAHCWSEATYACQGPDSPSCGGPVIAGSADGPCAAMQGGLGLFQLDAGTWSDTLARYGDAILTVEGNTAQAVSFVIDQVVRDIPGATGWLAAADWINGVPLAAGDPVMAQWAQLLACRYNGCCAASALCTQRAGGYRDHALEVYGELGAAFWRTSDRCAALPADGVIDQRTACYVAGGDPRSWHGEAAGYGGSRDWAPTGGPSLARWILRLPAAGRYRVEVYAAGGEATASYQVAHAGPNGATNGMTNGVTVDAIAVDQAAAAGFVALGDFDFAASGDEHVELDAAGAPGAPGQKLVFDAIRVTRVTVSDARGMLAP
ncbi:MAG TPA: hypothetical protein VF516_31270 [Kofleriaceae bacterium]